MTNVYLPHEIKDWKSSEEIILKVVIPAFRKHIHSRSESQHFWGFYRIKQATAEHIGAKNLTELLCRVLEMEQDVSCFYHIFSGRCAMITWALLFLLFLTFKICRKALEEEHHLGVITFFHIIDYRSPLLIVLLTRSTTKCEKKLLRWRKVGKHESILQNLEGVN